MLMLYSWKAFEQVVHEEWIDFQSDGLPESFIVHIPTWTLSLYRHLIPDQRATKVCDDHLEAKQHT